MASELGRYLGNCFPLLVPVLVWDAFLAKYLPWGYASDGAWARVPGGLRALENALRVAVLLAPVFLRLGVSSGWQRAGFGLYAIGLIAYAASWLAQIEAPKSSWSRSLPGYLAPAYTSGIWLTGVGLIGEQLVFEVPYRRWIYLVVAGAFVAVHTAHAYRAYDLLETSAGSRPTSASG